MKMIRLLKNKKGSEATSQLIATIFRLLFTTIVLLAVLFVISSSASKQFETGSAEAAILVNRIIYSQEGISYLDKMTGRLYPLEIDFEPFGTPEQMAMLDKTFDQGKINEYAIQIILCNEKGCYAETYYNKKMYDVWSPIGDADKTSTAKKTKGNIERFDFEYPVIVRTIDHFKEGGTLMFYVYHPRGIEG